MIRKRPSIKRKINNNNKTFSNFINNNNINLTIRNQQINPPSNNSIPLNNLNLINDNSSIPFVYFLIYFFYLFFSFEIFFLSFFYLFLEYIFSLKKNIKKIYLLKKVKKI